MIIETKLTTTIDEIETLMNKHFSEFEFTQMVENGSYVILSLDDIAIKSLKKDLDWEQGKSKQRYERLLNQLDLVIKLRDMGYQDEILVLVSW